MKIWRTICFLMLFSALLLGTSFAAEASGPLRILIDGLTVETDVPPFIDANNRTMVPVRFVSEGMGCHVEWDAGEQRVMVSRPGKTVALYIMQKTAVVDGIETDMDTTAILKSGRTMVPLRFLAEAFGLKVEWNQKNQTVSIFSPPEPTMPPEKTVPDSQLKSATVTGNIVNIRSGPGTGYSRLTQVAAGTRLNVLAENGEWLHVETPGGGKGWIAGEFVALNDPIPDRGADPHWNYFMPAGVSRYALVMKESVNVRSFPDLTSPSIIKVTLGQQLEVTGEQNGWYAVRLPDGRNGWVAGWLVAIKYDADKQKPAPEENPATGLISRWVAGERNTAGDLPFITGVEVEQSGNGVTLKIDADYPISPPLPLRLDNPSRLAFDFQAYIGEETEALSPTLPVNYGPVDRFRLGQFDDRTVRVVADLLGPASFELTQDAEKGTVSIRIYPVNTAGKLIAIDPGHGERNEWGGADPGAIGPTGLRERDVVLNISLQLGNILLNEGFAVIYTCENDTGLTLGERAFAAGISDAELLVSIHANASVNRSMSGSMTFYHASCGTPRESRMLASFIQSELLNRLQREDKGVRDADYVVLRNSSIPATLIEIAFISNPEEERLLADETFRRHAAEAIAIGIKRFLTARE